MICFGGNSKGGLLHCDLLVMLMMLLMVDRRGDRKINLESDFGATLHFSYNQRNNNNNGDFKFR